MFYAQVVAHKWRQNHGGRPSICGTVLLDSHFGTVALKHFTTADLQSFQQGLPHFL